MTLGPGIFPEVDVIGRSNLDRAALVLRRLLQQNVSFVKRTRNSISVRTLDSHFLVRSTESGFSYRWGSVSATFGRGGLRALGSATRRRYPTLDHYQWSFAEDMSFWALLAWHGFVDLKSYGEVVEQYEGRHSPMKVPATRWRIEAFVRDLECGLGGQIGRRFAAAIQWVAKHGCWLPRWRTRPYYAVLRNSYFLKREHQGSFVEFLRSCIKPGSPRSVSWEAIGGISDDQWRSLAPWKHLYGVGENIFFYVLRDVYFGPRFCRSSGAFKLDTRNRAFFRENDLWRLGNETLGETNANAVYILRKINSRIKELYPSWCYSVADLNAAIYASRG